MGTHPTPADHRFPHPTSRHWARFPPAAAVALALTLPGASAARATPPAQFSVPFQATVADTSVCGFGIRWDISAVAQIQVFSAANAPSFEIEHVREHNTLTNLSTGKTVGDDPVYQEILHLDAQGHVTSADVIGLWVNAREGGDGVTDVGRVVIAVNPLDGSHEMVFEAGRHPVREIAQANLQQDLVAFCDLLS